MTLRNLLSSLLVTFAVFTAVPSYADEQPVLNINNASIEQLVKIKGIGERKAQAIIEYRLKNGNFSHVNDLVKVKGISANFVEKNHAMLSVE